MSRKPLDLETRGTASPPLTPPRRRWQMILFGFILLVSGIVIGVAGNEYFHKVMRDRFIDHPEQATRMITKRLQSELDLSSEQADRVEKILEKRMQTLRAIQQESRPRMDRELDELRDEVAQVLNDDQKQRWLEHFAQVRHFLPPPFLPPPGERGRGGGR